MKNIIIIIALTISKLIIAQDCNIITNINSNIEIIIEDNTSYFNLCPGENLSIEATASYINGEITSPNYTWLIDETEYSNQPVFSETFDTPGGYIISLYVDDNDGCETIEPIRYFVRVSTIPSIDLSVSPSIVCPEVIVNIGADASSDLSFSGIISPGSWESSACEDEYSDATYLPDGSGVSYTTDIYLGCFGEGQTLTDANDILSVDINMEHSYSGDLDIYLTAPNGVQVTLFEQAGGSTWFGEATDGDATETNPGVGYDYGWSMNPEYNGTMIDGVTNNIIPDPAGGFSNILIPTIYLPVGDFNDFLGTPINGTWTITVTDNLGIDNGWIFSWGISLNQNIIPSSWSFENTIEDEYFINNPTIISNQGSSISVIPNVGSNSYYYEVVDNFGCTFSEALVITGTSFMDVVEDISDEYCGANDGEVTLNISGGTPEYTVFWSNGAQGTTLNNLSEGTYSYTIIDNLGCEISQNVPIQNSELELQFDTNINPDRCDQGLGSIEIIPLNGSNPYAYQVNGEYLNNANLSNLYEGSYFIEITDSFGCQGGGIIELNNILGPNANFIQSHDTVTFVDGLVEFNSQSYASNGAFIVDYQWNFGNGFSVSGEQTEFDFDAIGNYNITLTVTDDGNCSDTFSSEVISVEDYWAFSPTSFTPNGDGINDFFKIKFDNIIESTLQVFIYDRWGKLVYESKGASEGWDGIRIDNGAKADASSYVYYASFNTNRNKLQEKKGILLLLN